MPKSRKRSAISELVSSMRARRRKAAIEDRHLYANRPQTIPDKKHEVSRRKARGRVDPEDLD